MKYLALDLGTKLGWAACDGPIGEVTVDSGTEILATPKEIKLQRAAGQDRLCDIRVLRLRRFLRQKLSTMGTGVGVIGFEDVLFASTSMQAHLWAGFRTVVWLVAHDIEAKVIALPVQTLKKFATGHGGATKEMMAAALFARMGPPPQGRRVDDNEVDALHLLRYIVARNNS